MSDAGFTDDRLREALAGLIETAGDGSACPSPERLVESARGELPRPDDDGMILHIGECTACATGWKIAHDVAREGAAEERIPAARSPISLTWVRWAAAAAMLIAVVTGGVLVLSPDRTGDPAYREQADEMLRSELREDEALSRAAFVLRWVAAPEGAVYDVVVTDERMTTLARGMGLDRAEYQVPEKALREIASGRRLFWQVSAHLPDGRRIESPTFIATVR